MLFLGSHRLGSSNAAPSVNAIRPVRCNLRRLHVSSPALTSKIVRKSQTSKPIEMKQKIHMPHSEYISIQSLFFIVNNSFQLLTITSAACLRCLALSALHNVKRQLLRSGRFVLPACLGLPAGIVLSAPHRNIFVSPSAVHLFEKYAPLSLGLATSAPLTDDPPSLCRGQWAGPWSPHRCFLLRCRGGDNLYVAIHVLLCNTFLHFFCIFLHLFFATVKNPVFARLCAMWYCEEISGTLSDKC